MKTIDKIITKVDCKYGAPMGRQGVAPVGFGSHCNVNEMSTRLGKRVFDCAVPLVDGYDKGGAYWGAPSNLRVSYTKDLKYIHFYRKP